MEYAILQAVRPCVCFFSEFQRWALADTPRNATLLSVPYLGARVDNSPRARIGVACTSTIRHWNLPGSF
jgi:hypothetical protein